MVSCFLCAREPDGDTLHWLRIAAVSFSISPKSGRYIPEDDCFPDDDDEKYLCWECLTRYAPDIAGPLQGD